MRPVKSVTHVQIAPDNFKLGLFEARAFDVHNRVERKLFPRT